MLHSKGDEKTNGGVVISFESLQESVVTPPSTDVCKTEVTIAILVVVCEFKIKLFAELLENCK